MRHYKPPRKAGDFDLQLFALIDLDEENGFETADLPGQGDVDAGGGGVTVSSLTNQNVLDSVGLGNRVRSGRAIDPNTGEPIGRHLTPGLAGNPVAEHPAWTIIILAVVLLLMKFIPKEDREDSKNVKIGVGNGLRITFMAMLGILLAKIFFGIWNVSSISPTIEYV